MSFVVKYPDRPALLEPMICLAKEELAHFHEVYREIHKLGLQLTPDEKDPYVKGLLGQVRHGREEHFLDRLLVSAVIEARGGERFKMVGEHLPDQRLGDLARRAQTREQLGRGLWCALFERCRRALEYRVEHLSRCGRVVVRPFARDQVVQHRADREDVRAFVNCLPARLLRCHVGRCADHLTFGRQQR